MCRCTRLFELCKGVCSREEKKKKHSLDLAWVGLSCRSAFKIMSGPSFYKKHGFLFAPYTYWGVSMGEQQEPKCKLVGWLEFTTTTNPDDGPLKCLIHIMYCRFQCQSVDCWGQWWWFMTLVHAVSTTWGTYSWFCDLAEPTVQRHTESTLRCIKTKLLEWSNTLKCERQKARDGFIFAPCSRTVSQSLHMSQHLSEASGLSPERTWRLRLFEVI